MADAPNVFWNTYINPNRFREETVKVSEDGEIKEHKHMVAGVPELGYVDPETNCIVFESELRSDKDVPAGPSEAPMAEVTDAKRADLDAAPVPDLPLVVDEE